MTTLLFLVDWLLLFVLCWTFALAAQVIWPIAWLISIPLRLLGIGFDAALHWSKPSFSSGKDARLRCVTLAKQARIRVR